MLEINKIHQGDCLELMPLIPDKSVNMVLCDLPYGTTACQWDTIINFDKLWEQYNRIIKDNGVIVLTASQPFTSALIMSNPKMFKHSWVWEKQKASNFMNMKYQPAKYHEDIIVFGKNKVIYNPQMWYVDESKRDKRKTVNHCINPKESHYGNMDIKLRKSDDGSRYPKSIIKIDRGVNKNLHPTQKPVELGRYLVRTYTNEGDLVLDNTCGVGSFPLSAKIEGRNFIGIELDEKYCEIARQRIEQEKGLK